MQRCVCVCGAKSVGQLPLYLERLKQPSSIEACCLCCNVAQNGTRSVQRTALDGFIAISRDAAPKDTQKASLFIFPFSKTAYSSPQGQCSSAVRCKTYIAYVCWDVTWCE